MNRKIRMWNTDRIVHAVGLFYIVQSVMLIGVAVYAGSWGLALPAVTGLPVAFALLYVRKKQKNRERRMLSALKGKEASLLEAEEIWLSEELCQIVEGLLREQQEQSRYYQGKYAEYLALQTQINPHFLYNTLEAIRGDALCEGVGTIAETTEALSTFFRYTISEPETLVPLERELDHVDNYFIIQKYRFGDRIALEQIHEDTGEEAQKLLVPKLILQPIVENAIYHGLEGRGTGGKIFIKIELTDSRLLITVSDDGVGIEKEKVRKINENLAHSDRNVLAEGHHGIALDNVSRRIKLLFGEYYGIKLFSVEGFGTQVIYTLPKLTSLTELEKI